MVNDALPAGTAYLGRTAAGTPLVRTWSEVQSILSTTTDKLSQQAILERWPTEEDRPERSTLSRWLKRATQQGLVCCSGSGNRGDSFLYWLPGREPLLWPGYNASEADMEAWRERWAAHERSQREQPGSA